MDIVASGRHWEPTQIDHAYSLFPQYVLPRYVSQSGRQPMSSHLSVLALCVAWWTWWIQPLPSPAYFPEVSPQPQAEFACSARCPSVPGPPPGVPSHFVESRFGLWTGSSPASAAAWHLPGLSRRHSGRPSLVIESRALVNTSFDVPEETEPQLSIEGPLTPALRRRLRQQRNGGSA